MKRRWITLIALLGIVGIFSAAAGAPVTETLCDSDVIVRAMVDELNRSMKELVLKDLDRPYFIQYTVRDSIVYQMQATYGALVSSARSRDRTFTGKVRVGSYELDDTNFAEGGGFLFGRSGAGGGVRATLPLDDDYLAIRQAIWRAIDRGYKDGVETLTKKRAHLKGKTIEDRPNDFTRGEPVTATEPAVTLRFDKDAWEANVKKLSARFKWHPEVQDAEVMLFVGAEHRTIVNSEGSRLRTADSGFLVRVTAEVQADDGMKTSDELTYGAERDTDLPAIERIEADIDALARRLIAVKNAPVLDAYSGPVLFDDRAGPQLFAALLAPGLAGKPDPLGEQRRIPGGVESLEAKIGKRILPKTFQAYDDPTVKEYGGAYLFGHYRFDDEGVPARKVSLVENGRLGGLCMSRAPNKKLSGSTGHGRARGDSPNPEASIASLFISCDDGLSAEELKARLIEACEEADLEFGLRIAALKPGGVTRSDMMSFFRRMQSGTAPSVVPPPVYAYKVYVKDGREELVRGIEFAPLQVRALKRILAAGNDRKVLNRALESDLEGLKPPTSIIAPAVLFEDLELPKIKEEFDKPPILRPPAVRGK